MSAAKPAVIRAALSHPNVRAFLRVIREGESGQGDDAYTIVNGGGHFPAPPWAHPSHGIPTTRGGRAAGAFQFLGTTWANLAAAYPDDCADFSPSSQDFGAVALMSGRGALDAVMAGDLRAAVGLLAQEWVSLPAMKPERVLRVFTQYGGAIQPAPEPQRAPNATDPTPRMKEQPMPDLGDTIADAAPIAGTIFGGPIGGLLGGLAAALIRGFQPLAREKIEKEVARHTDNPATAAEVSTVLTNGVVRLAQQITGKADPVEAVLVAKADPAAMQQIEASTMAKLDELAPLFDKIAQYEQAGWTADESSRAAAAARASSEAGARIQWRQVTFTQYAIGIGTVAVFALLLAQIVTKQAVNEMIAGLFVMLLTTLVNTFRTQNDYSFGSSHGSDAKTVAMTEIAARRPRTGQ